MYEEFYSLKSRPFLIVPDPDFLVWGETHSLAFTMLRYGMMTRAPITVVTGEIGSGKTTLLRQLLRETPGDITLGLISNMQTGRGELLHWVMMALDQPFQGASYVEIFRLFQDFLIQRYAEGRRVVLIFDEAQNLGVDALEELRMLSNINADKDELLQLILVGQPQLRAMLASPNLVQFTQRISADFHLTALGREETEHYVGRRLEIAGAKWRIFPSETCGLIHEAAHGVPRLINTLCDLCLVYGYAAEAKVISMGLVREFLSGARRRGIYTQFSVGSDGATLLHQAR